MSIRHQLSLDIKKTRFETWISAPIKDELRLPPLACVHPRISFRAPSPSIVASFISYLYAKKVEDLDVLRFNMYMPSVNDSFRDLTPAICSLTLAMRRAAFQVGLVWGNSLKQVPTPPMASRDARTIFCTLGIAVFF